MTYERLTPVRTYGQQPSAQCARSKTKKKNKETLALSAVTAAVTMHPSTIQKARHRGDMRRTVRSRVTSSLASSARRWLRTAVLRPPLASGRAAGEAQGRAADPNLAYRFGIDRIAAGIEAM